MDGRAESQGSHPDSTSTGAGPSTAGPDHPDPGTSDFRGGGNGVGQRRPVAGRRVIYLASCAVTLLVTITVLRAGFEWSWFVIAAILVGLVGIMLWAPTSMDPTSLASFGTGLATGAVVSGILAVINVQDTHNQNRLAALAQQQAQRIATQSQAQQNRIALSQQEHQSQLAQQQSQREALNLQLTVTRYLRGVDLSNDYLLGRSLNGKDLAGANLYGVHLNNGRLLRTNLTHARANLATFTGADLRSAKLTGATLQGALFDRAILDESDLVRANLGVSHVNGVVRRAVMYGAHLYDANVRGACLAGADLRNARFGGANLGGADLDRADLRGARLIFAGLPANLAGASIAGAKIEPSQRHYFKHAAAVTPGLRRTLLAGGRMPAHTLVGRITDVYDGQTAYVVPLGWVRLIGVTVPNLDFPFGPQAQRLFSTAVGSRRVIRYQFGQVRRERRWGNTGRWLIYAWNTHGMFINEQLLRAGYAVRRPDSQEGRRYASVFSAATYFARATGKGLWTICPSPPQ